MVQNNEINPMQKWIAKFEDARKLSMDVDAEQPRIRFSDRNHDYLFEVRTEGLLGLFIIHKRRGDEYIMEFTPSQAKALADFIYEMIGEKKPKEWPNQFDPAFPEGES